MPAEETKAELCWSFQESFGFLDKKETDMGGTIFSFLFLAFNTNTPLGAGRDISTVRTRPKMEEMLPEIITSPNKYQLPDSF